MSDQFLPVRVNFHMAHPGKIVFVQEFGGKRQEVIYNSDSDNAEMLPPSLGG